MHTCCCWAFSAIAAVEGLTKIVQGNLTDSTLHSSFNQVSHFPGMFGINPASMAVVSAQPSDRIRIEVPSLRDEDITPPPRVPLASRQNTSKKKKKTWKNTSAPVEVEEKPKRTKKDNSFFFVK
ncbi:unnamed protein product [Cochlearia groenlandica]